MTRPLASVVVPVHNRLELVRPVLDAFATQRTPEPFEVIVVDDGSEPPAAAIVAGRDDRFRLLTQPNRGRAGAVNAGLAAARGDVVIVCDSDIVPEPGFVEDHLAFHREHAAVEDTHLGALAWGVEPGPFAALLGPRANPRMTGFEGAVPWTLWYTDNWSVKRALVESGPVRFDETFRAWGWEDLELARRLAVRGVRNHATAAAAGRHLQAPTLESMLAKFAGSVPNLLHLAAGIGRDEHVAGWLSLRRADPRLVDAGEAILRHAVGRIESLSGRLNRLHTDVVRILAINLSNAVFRCGVQRGFVGAGLHQPDSPPGATAAEVQLHAYLVRVVAAILRAVDTPDEARRFVDDCARTGAIVGGGGDVLGAFLERVEGGPRGPHA